MNKKKSSLKKGVFAFLFSLCAYNSIAQNENIGFELGTTANWICGSGSYGIDRDTCGTKQFPFILNYDGNCLNQGGIDGTNTPTDASTNRHILVSSGWDANGGITCVAPANLFPDGAVNKYSLRLGNALGASDVVYGKSRVEAIKYAISVDSSNASLTLLYAAFLKSDEMQPLSTEADYSQFEIKITDTKNKLVDCGYYRVTKLSPGLISGPVDMQGVWKSTGWKSLALDLVPYIGQTLQIEFVTRDCVWKSPMNKDTCMFQGGDHSAYAYIDMYCKPVEVIHPFACANQDTIKLCAPNGYMAYQWDVAPGMKPPYDQQCITINNPKVGDIYSVKMRSILGGCFSSAKMQYKWYDFHASDVSICTGTNVQLNAVPTYPGNFEFKWEPATNLDQDNIPNPLFAAGSSTTYTVTMTNKNDNTNCKTAKVVHVNVMTKATVSVTNLTIHKGETATLNGKVPNGKGEWIGGQGTFTPDRFTLNAVYKPTPAEESAGSVELSLEASDSAGVCPKTTKVMTITILNATDIIDLNENEITVEVYPNPFTTESTLVIHGLPNTSSAMLKMYDHLGKEISFQKLNGSNKLRREQLPAGMYFIEIVAQGKVVARKKVIVND